MEVCQTLNNLDLLPSPASIAEMSSHITDLDVHAVSHSPQEQWKSRKLDCTHCCENIPKETKTDNPRNEEVTESQLADICDDVGNCWRELGPRLKIKAAKIRNIDSDYRSSYDKANALLIMWIEQEGRNAKVGRLADVLVKIGRKRIAEKLLGESEAPEIPTYESVSIGDVISLTVNAMENKVFFCEDAHGNKFIAKAVNGSKGHWNSKEIQKNKDFLDKVAAAAQDMEKPDEQRLQECLKRYSLGLEEVRKEVQELRQQVKCIKVDCGDHDGESSAGISSPEKDAQPSAELEKVPLQDAAKLLLSCEDYKAHFNGFYHGLIERIGEVAQLGEDNFMCFKDLCNFIREFRDEEEKTFVPKMKSLHDMKLDLGQFHLAQVEELEKWSKVQKKQLDEVEKLLSSVFCQGITGKNRCQSESYVSMTSSSGSEGKGWRAYSFKGCWKSQTLEERPDLNQKCDDISPPFCPQRMSSICIDTDKKLEEKRP